MKINRSIFTFSVMFLLIVGFAAAQQEAPRVQSNASNLPAETGYKTVQVIILNDDDEHIQGLTKDMFKVTINNIQQPIVSLREVSGFKPQDAITPVKPEEQSLFILLLANAPRDSRQYEKYQDGLNSFLDELQISSPIAVVIIYPSEIRKAVDFTLDKNALKQQISELFAVKAFPDEMAFFEENNQFAVVRTLTSLIQAFSNVKGRKFFILVSAGIPDTMGLNFYDTASSGQSQMKDITESGRTSISMEQSRQEAQLRKKMAELISETCKMMLISNSKLDFIDLSKAVKPRGAVASIESRSSATSTGTSTSTQESDYSTFGNRFQQGLMMKVDDEVRLRIPKDLVNAGGGEVFERALTSSGKLTDYLTQIFYINSHYYVIEFKLNLPEAEAGSIIEINVETTNEDAERIIYNKKILQ